MIYVGYQIVVLHVSDIIKTEKWKSVLENVCRISKGSRLISVGLTRVVCIILSIACVYAFLANPLYYIAKKIYFSYKNLLFLFEVGIL